MSYVKPEVKKFKDHIKKSVNDNFSNDNKEESFAESMTMIYSVLIDIRDALIPNNPNDKNT